MDKDLDLALSLDLEDLESLFDYIVVSSINGNPKQSKELFLQLENKLDCIFYIQNKYPSFLIDLNVALYR